MQTLVIPNTTQRENYAALTRGISTVLMKHIGSPKGGNTYFVTDLTSTTQIRLLMKAFHLLN